MVAYEKNLTNSDLQSSTQKTNKKQKKKETKTKKEKKTVCQQQMHLKLTWLASTSSTTPWQADRDRDTS